jgi:hypothetical protein
MAAKKGGKWIQAAAAKMKKRGTVGAFGKATPSKIAAAKKKGGLQEKRAVFAANMKKIAAKHRKAKGGKKMVGSKKSAKKKVTKERKEKKLEPKRKTERKEKSEKK